MATCLRELVNDLDGEQLPTWVSVFVLREAEGHRRSVQIQPPTFSFQPVLWGSDMYSFLISPWITLWHRDAAACGYVCVRACTHVRIGNI